jgi:HSP20 family molecular chaperone IbpA
MYRCLFDYNHEEPKVNCYFKENEMILLYNLAGHDKENILIEIEEDIIIVKSKIEKELFGDVVFKNFDLDDINIPIRVSSRYDLATIKTDWKNGLLSLTIEKRNKKKTIKI